MKSKLFKNRIYIIVSVIAGLIITIALYLDNLIKLAKLNEYGIYGVIGFILLCLTTFLLVFLVTYLICFIVFKIKLKHQDIHNEWQIPICLVC